MPPSLTRLIIVYISLPIIVAFFFYLAYKVLKRSKQRISKIFGAFYISIAIGNTINLFYAPLDVTYAKLIIIILHIFTIFFIFLGLIFILVANLIILSSTISFTTKKQNILMVFYAILLGGMFVFIPFGEIDANIEGYPVWSPIFFTYVMLVVSLMTVIPILYTSFLIIKNFENKALKKRWMYFIIGFLGLLALLYGIMVANLMNLEFIRTGNTIYSLTVIIWVLLMYYGIGKQLKN